ncbi:MAG: hypothetical protein ACRCUY_14215 [Thermoguttaceae bacterium]
MTETSIPTTCSTKCPPKWYWRKRYWLLVILILGIYFCFIPSRFVPTYETTGLEHPKMKNGKVDYFAEFEKTYIDKFVPPEQNGMRDMIAALGPTILEQMSMVEKVEWDEMPSHESSKNWFETYWIPLCEHMSIDPYKKPYLYEKRGFYNTMAKLKKAKKAAAEKSQNEGDPEQTPQKDDDPDNTELWQKLVDAPWKAADYPEVAEWLVDYSPVLDLFGKAVRKPNYVCWKKTADDLMLILLPDIQAERDIARSVRIRITERLGRDDIEGAWYDVLSLFYLGHHFKKDAVAVTALVGMAIENMGMEAAKLILVHPKMNDELLQKFAAELDQLSTNSLTLNWQQFERLIPFVVLQQLRMSNIYKHEMPLSLQFLVLLPIDRNIAGKYLTKRLREGKLSAWQKTPALANKNSIDDVVMEIRESVTVPKTLLRIPLIRTRSELIAEQMVLLLSSAEKHVQTAFNRITSKMEMFRVAIALERYKNKYGDYPATLEEIFPEFLEFYPLDPFTGRSNFVYKKEQGETMPIRLYSVGENGIDDGGVFEPSQKKFMQLDEVFW